jgi:hypothetical protein
MLQFVVTTYVAIFSAPLQFYYKYLLSVSGLIFMTIVSLSYHPTTWLGSNSPTNNIFKTQIRHLFLDNGTLKDVLG